MFFYRPRTNFYGNGLPQKDSQVSKPGISKRLKLGIDANDYIETKPDFELEEELPHKSLDRKEIIYHSDVKWLKEFSSMDISSLSFDKKLLLQECKKSFKKTSKIPTMLITCDQTKDSSYSLKVEVQIPGEDEDLLQKSFKLQEENQVEIFKLSEPLCGEIRVSRKGLFVNDLSYYLNYVFKTTIPLFITNLETKGYIDIDCSGEVSNNGLLDSDSWIRIKASGIHNTALENQIQSIIKSNDRILLQSSFLNNHGGRICSREVFGHFDELKNTNGLISGISKSILASEKFDIGRLKTDRGCLVIMTKDCNITERDEISCDNLFIQCDNLDLKGIVKVSQDLIVRVKDGFDYSTESLQSGGKIILAFQKGFSLKHPIDTPGILEITLPTKAVDPFCCLANIRAKRGLRFFLASALVFGSESQPPIQVTTQESLEIFQDGLMSEKEAELAVTKQFKGPQIFQSSIKIYGEFSIGDEVKVFAPRATLCIGSNKHQVFSELVLEKAHLKAYVRDFDLKNGKIVALSAVIHAPQGIYIGRLIEDPSRKILSTFYCHSQRPDSNSLGDHMCNFDYKFLDQSRADVYDGNHLLILPMVTSNSSTLLIQGQTKLKGTLENNGTLITGDLILDSEKDSVCKAASITVNGNFYLEGKGNLNLERETGKLHYNYYPVKPFFLIFGLSSPKTVLSFVASDPSKLEVCGTLSSTSPLSIFNQASIVYVHKKHPNVSYTDKSVEAPIYQKFVNKFDPFGDINPQLAVTERNNMIIATTEQICIAREFLMRTNNFEGAVRHFNAQFSSDQPVVLPDATNLQGRLCAPSILAQASKEGLILGSHNSSLVEKKEENYNLMEDKFNIHTTLVSRMPSLSPSNSSIPQFNFAYRERYWFNETRASQFYKGIASFVAIETSQGTFRELDANSSAFFSLSPNLLKERIREKCLQVLKRGFLYENSPIDDETVKQLHKNTTDYLNKINPDFEKEGSQNSLKLRRPNSELPSKPMIYYVSIVNDAGTEQLSPVIYFPLSMIENAQGKRGGVRASSLSVIPKGLTVDQIVSYFQDRPLFRPFLKNFSETISLNCDGTQMICEKQDQILSSVDRPISGPISLQGDFDVGKMIILSEGHLQSSANIEAENVLLASLCGDTLIGSKTERVCPGSMDNFFERISEKARIHARGILTILSEGNIGFAAAEIHSELNTHIEALQGIYDIPVNCMMRRVQEYQSKRCKERTEIVSIIPHTSSYSSGKQITLKANNMILSAVDVNAPKAFMEAEDNIEFRDVHKEHQYSFESMKKSSCRRKRMHQEYSHTKISKGSNFHDTNLSVKTNGDFSAVNLQNNGEIEIEAPKGEVKIGLGMNSYHSESFTRKSNCFIEKQIHQTEDCQTYTESFPSELVKISALKAYIQQKPKRKRERFGRRSKALEPSNIINNTGKPLEIEYVQDYRFQNRKVKKRLTPEFRSLLTLTVGLATGYAGAAIASTAGIASTSSVVAANFSALKAGASSVLSQTLIGGLENNFKFDFRSLATSILTAGLTNFVCNNFDIKPPHHTEIKDGITLNNVTEHLKYNATKSLISSAVNVAVNKQDLGQALLNSCKETAIQTIGAVGANEIASSYADNHINYVEHKLAHGALGALIGGLTSSDPLMGMAAGAQGAVIAETVAGLFVKSVEEIDFLAKESGNEGNFQMELEEDMGYKRDLAQMVSSLTAFAAGQDVAISSSTADNALNNNCVNLVYFLLRASFIYAAKKLGKFVWNANLAVFEEEIERIRLPVCQRIAKVLKVNVETITKHYDEYFKVSPSISEMESIQKLKQFKKDILGESQ